MPLLRDTVTTTVATVNYSSFRSFHRRWKIKRIRIWCEGLTFVLVRACKYNRAENTTMRVEGYGLHGADLPLDWTIESDEKYRSIIYSDGTAGRTIHEEIEYE